MMKNKLHIACIQSDILWENINGNIQKYSELTSTISKQTDLIILPEMFSTGFSMNPQNCAETMNGLSVSWMKTIAFKRNVAIMGSLAIKEDGNYYNRLIIVLPNGELSYYDKRHLFTLVGEHKVYTSGKEKLIIEYLGWKICPMICYDLRFPIWSRNTENYDVLVYMANWPKLRIDAWDTLLKARAIENMSYCIGVNRVGVDANNYEYVGNSQVFDSLGNLIANTTEGKECIFEITLDKSEQESIRNKFQFLNDRDSFVFN